MALAETSTSRKVVLPSGNEWQFSDRNSSLNPRVYNQESTDILALSENMRHIVSMVGRDYIKEGWNFASVLGPSYSEGFAIVFTNDLRTETVSKWLSPDFLQPNIPENPSERTNFWPLPLAAINRLLEGTNLYAYNAHAAFNEITIERERGIFKKTKEQMMCFQSGVAYILANVHSIEDQLQFYVNPKIDELVENLKNQLEPLKAEKAALLAARTETPVKLFPH